MYHCTIVYLTVRVRQTITPFSVTTDDGDYVGWNFERSRKTKDDDSPSILFENTSASKYINSRFTSKMFSVINKPRDPIFATQNDKLGPQKRKSPTMADDLLSSDTGSKVKATFREIVSYLELLGNNKDEEGIESLKESAKMLVSMEMERFGRREAATIITDLLDISCRQAGDKSRDKLNDFQR